MTAPRIDSYAWSGGSEAILRFGPDQGRIVVLALPLFEEANRTRTFAVALLRALADRGIAGALPDLPATGDSIVATRDLSLFDLRSAFEAAVEHVWSGRRVFVVGIRSGCLFDTLPLVAGRWHLAPITGTDVVRELGKTASLGGTEDPVEIAGNLISRAFLAELAEAMPATPEEDACLRIVRLTSDPRPADRKIDAAPLWRRSEPGDDPTLVEMLATDITGWIATCAG